MNKGGPQPRIAVVGVSSLIGTAVIDELRARKFPYSVLHTLDDERDLGKPLADDEGEVRSKTPPAADVAGFDFSSADLVFFCGRSVLAERYAEGAAEHAWVIDSSAVFAGAPRCR